MTLDADTVAKIVGPLLSLLLGAVVKHYAEARAKLVSFIGHVSSFTLQDDQHTVVHTHSVVVRNAGRKAAQNVRLSHRVLPVNVTVYPRAVRTEGVRTGAILSRGLPYFHHLETP